MLRVEVGEPAVVRWSADGWKTSQDLTARDTGLGLFLADLPTKNLPIGTKVEFTFDWTSAGKWEGENYAVIIQ